MSEVTQLVGAGVGEQCPGFGPESDSAEVPAIHPCPAGLLSPGTCIMTREVESREAVAGDEEGDGRVWHRHAASRSQMAENCIKRVAGLEQDRAQTGSVMRVSAAPGREGGRGEHRGKGSL